MEIPLSGDWVIAPGGLLHTGENHSDIRVRRLLFRPDIPIPIFGVGFAPCFPEPRVLIRGVIDDQIDEHADAALLCSVGELHEVAERAEARIYFVVVRNIVAVIAAGRGLKRHEPDGGNAEPREVVEAPHEPLEVPYAVAVCIHVGRDRQAVDHRVFVPEVVDHTYSPSSERMMPSCGARATRPARTPSARPGVVEYNNCAARCGHLQRNSADDSPRFKATSSRSSRVCRMYSNKAPSAGTEL